jgi:pyruvate/2-oxoglutarate dehydrogenase complex dihydrolipoamide acyltransferase (E2) component
MIEGGGAGSSRKAPTRSSAPGLSPVGDRVEENDPLVELETDKVAVEVPAPSSGVLREIVLHSSDEAAPGAVLGRMHPLLK